MRFSKQREQILSIVKSTSTHPDAEWVYNEAKKHIPNISLGTVYRNLRHLSDSGWLRTLETSLGSIRYDGDTSDHIHFVCNHCGRIYDVPHMEEVLHTIDTGGHKIEEGKIVLYGTCRGCLGARQELEEIKLIGH